MKQSVFFLKSSLMNKAIPLLCISVCFFLIILVTNTTLTFASTEISSSVGTVRLNQDLFEVSNSKSELVKVYGSILSAQKGDKMTIIFKMPNGETEGSQVFTTEDGYFESFLRLDDRSQQGPYTVFVSFKSIPLGELTFSVTKKQFSVEDNTITSLPTPQFIEQIILTIDKNSYSDREKIMVSGDIRTANSKIPVTIQIISPNGNLVIIEQIQADADGIFNTELIAGGPTWTSQGQYMIKAFYGGNTRTAETTFYFDGTTNNRTSPQTSNSSIDVAGYELDFQITGGNISSIITDVNANSLIISIDATNDGSVTLAIPRSVLDTLLGDGSDDDFFVLVDGNQVEFDEITLSTERILTIAFPAGAEEIEIIGTHTITSATKPKITYYDTQLSLQVQDSSRQGYIKVFPTLTYGSGNSLSTNNVSISVDGISKTTVSSNQWSSDIYAGSGVDHTIKASFPEMTSNTNTLIKYRSSSDTVNHFVKAATTVSSSGTSSESFPTGYVIVGIVIAAVAVGIGIALSKRKKTAPVIYAQPAKVQTASDETQFWVCPNCGRDIQMKDGKQYCPSCNVYL